MIDNNVYLIDFLNFMLVRDCQFRPSIHEVVKRFEHVHALLGSGSSQSNRYMIQPNIASIRESSSLDQILDKCQELMSVNQQDFVFYQTFAPSMLRIAQDIYLCNQGYALDHIQELRDLQITHVVTWEIGQDLSDIFIVFQLPANFSPLACVPGIMDFIRHTIITKGKIIFLETDYNMRIAMLVTLSLIFKTSAFETYTLINSQVLFCNLPHSLVQKISQFAHSLSIIRKYSSTFPRFQCLCGSCLIMLKRQNSDMKSLNSRNCSCSRQFRNVETSECPSPGCGDFLTQLKELFPQITWDSLTWGFSDIENFLIGPFCGDIQKIQHRELITESLSLDVNAEPFRTIEKRPAGYFARNYSPSTEIWRLYRCKLCQFWVYAISADSKRVAFLLNGMIKGIKPGLLKPGGEIPVLKNVKLQGQQQ